MLFGHHQTNGPSSDNRQLLLLNDAIQTDVVAPRAGDRRSD